MPLSAFAKAATDQFQSNENSQFDCRLHRERTRSLHFCCIVENDANAQTKHQQNCGIYKGLTLWQLRGKATAGCCDACALKRTAKGKGVGFAACLEITMRAYFNPKERWQHC
jgi:hypothetical protein